MQQINPSTSPGTGRYLASLRVDPFFLLLPLVTFSVIPGNVFISWKRIFIRAYVVVGVVCLSIVIFWWPFFRQSTAFSFLHNIRTADDVSKIIYGIAVFFQSLATLAVGWIVPIAETASLTPINKLLSYVGCTIFLSLLLFLWKKRLFFFRPLTPLLLWPILWYLPNWLVDPKLTIGITHRYFVLAGAGFVAFIALGLTRVQYKVFALCLAIIFLVSNIVMVWKFLDTQSRIRSSQIIDLAWNTVDRDLPSDGQNIILFQGPPVLVEYIGNMSEYWPIAIKRHIADPQDFPLSASSDENVVELLCTSNASRSILGNSYPLPKLPLSSVYAWELREDGTLISIHQKKRQEIMDKARMSDCELLL